MENTPFLCVARGEFSRDERDWEEEYDRGEEEKEDEGTSEDRCGG